MENQVNIQQVNIDHIQLEGQAFYDMAPLQLPRGGEYKNGTDPTNVSSNSSPRGGKEGAKFFFMFAPDDPVAGRVTRYRKQGVAQQMSDGTFDFVAKPKYRPQSTLIRKLAHGRASDTKDGAILLTLKVFKNEDVNISETIEREAQEAVDAIRNYQLKH